MKNKPKLKMHLIVFPKFVTLAFVVLLQSVHRAVLSVQNASVHKCDGSQKEHICTEYQSEDN